MSKSETRTLSLHPLAIHTFIRAQAGSLSKALAESVMNSIDAFAAHVTIILTATGFIVDDDGQGFLNRDEIASWFETLGFPHEEGNHRQYGTFGMGRAQAWAYASTVWTSNQFEMTVDVKTQGLDYQLRELAVARKGTRIVGTFYTPLDQATMLRTQTELEHALRYVPGIVTLNSKVINKDPAGEEWTFETEDAYFRIGQGRSEGLSVYNVGVFVKAYPRYSVPVGGCIVTKSAAVLRLNLARNEVLQSECPVWKRLLKSLAPYTPGEASKASKAGPTKTEIAALLAQFRAGELSLKQLTDQHRMALRSVNARPLEPWALCNWRAKHVLMGDRGDKTAQRLHTLRQAVIVDRTCLADLGVENAEGLKALVRKYMVAEKHMADSLARFDATVWGDDPRTVFISEYSGRSVLPLKDQSPAERAAGEAWQHTWSNIKSPLIELLPEDKKEAFKQAAIRIGDGHDPVWYTTEGGSAFVLRKDVASKLLARNAGGVTQRFLETLQLLLRAFLDSEPDGDALFMRAVTKTDLVGSVVPALLSRYADACRKFDVALPLPLLGALAAMDKTITTP